jgi:recombination endonuclease VII
MTLERIEGVVRKRNGTPEERRAYNRWQYLRHRDKQLARSREWRERNPEKLKEQREAAKANGNTGRWNRKYTYGLSDEDLDRMRRAQKDRCPGCWRRFSLLLAIPAKKSRMHVDHCPDSGRIRGLLCNACNRVLGIAMQRSETLRRLADYLDNEGVLSEDVKVANLKRCNRHRRSHVSGIPDCRSRSR